MRNHLLLRLALLFVFVLSASRAVAQGAVASSGGGAKGFQLGVHLNGSSLQFDEDETIESGGGLGLSLGYGFTPKFSLILGMDVASIDFADRTSAELFGGQYSLGQVDLGARYHFAGDSRWMPYAEGMLTGIAAIVDGGGDELTMSGGGLALGGGVQYFASPKVALNAGLRYTFGSFTEVEYDGRTEEIEDGGVTSARLNLGIVWYPSRR